MTTYYADASRPDVGSNYYDEDYNLFTKRAWNQVIGDLGANSLQESDETVIFTNYAGGDYTLKAGSPAIDAGIAGVWVDNVDYLGVSRGSPPDMGAYQYGSPKVSHLIVAGSLVLIVVTGGA